MELMKKPDPEPIPALRDFANSEQDDQRQKQFRPI